MLSLALCYFPFGFYFFSDKNFKTQNIGISIVFGWLLSVCIIGILFKLMYWPGSSPMLLIGTLTAVPLIGVAILLYIKSTDVLKNYYKNLLIRTSVLFLLSLLCFLLPNSVPYTDPQYRIEATADFNGDKKNDIIWRNIGTGSTRATTMVGRWATGGNEFGMDNAPYIDRTYTAIGVGDIDNDGHTDILWRNSKGVSFISFMYYSFEVWRTDYFNISTNLSGVGTGDFNGDGFNDFILQNKAGVMTVFYLSSRVGLFENLGTPPANYLPVMIGDFNGDKDPDVLLKHKSTGALAIIFNAAKPSRKILYSTLNGVVIPQHFAILAPGDYDGDGKDDVMVRNLNTTQMIRFNVIVNANRLVWSKNPLAGKVPLAYVNKF